MRIVLAALLILLGSDMHAQDAPPPSEPASLYWIDVGAGGGSYPGAIAGVFLKTAPSHLFVLRGAYIEEFRLCIFGPCSTPADYHGEIGAMYGWIDKGKWGSISASGGLALTFIRTGESSDGNESTKYTTIGIPLELQAFVTPFPFLGIGITATANGNPKQTFAGVFLTLQAGKLRD